MLFLGSSSTYSPHINHSGQHSPTKLFIRGPIFRYGLEARSNKTSSINPVNTKCRQRTVEGVQDGDLVQNADRRLGTKRRLRIYIIFSSDTWQHVILQLTERHATAFLRSSLTIICTIEEFFLARFWITVVLNIISSLHILFSLCAQVGWSDVCTEFTNLI